LGDVQVMGAALACYAVAWAVTRFLPGGLTVVVAGIVTACLAAAVFFLTQYQYLVIEAKVAALDAVARRVSQQFEQSRAWAPFPNSLATLLDGAACAAVGLAVSARNWRWRLLGIVAAGGLLLTVLVSASRGSWLAVAAALSAGVWVGARWPRPRFGLVGSIVGAAALAALAGAVWSSPPWWAAVAAAAGRPDRLDVYQHAATLLRDSPFTGIGGGGQFAVDLSKYALLIQVPFLTYSHNLVLDIWLWRGLPGLAAWAALAAATAAAAAAAERVGAGWRVRGVWMGVLAIHLHGLTDARQTIDGWTWAPFFVLTGALAATLEVRRVRLGRAAAIAPLVMAGAVAVAVVVARGAPVAAWHANLGAVAQARAAAASEAGPAMAAEWSRRAEARFVAALAAAPDDAPALRRLGMLELDGDRHAAAFVHLQQAFALDPATLSTRKAFGLAAVWTGDIDRAAAVLAGVPGITTELNTWSSWRRSLDQVELAARAARASLALDPGQIEMRDWLARLEAEASSAQP
jgi:O-antigen ligase